MTLRIAAGCLSLTSVNEGGKAQGVGGAVRREKTFYRFESEGEKMFPRYLMIGAAVLMLAACEKKPEDAGLDTTATDGMNAGDNMAGAPVPGSQEDLAVNVGDRVLFDTDSSDISQQGRSTLEHQAAWLAQYPNVNILVEGHADERGTREYNLALGERRANSTKNYLVTLGVDAGRINTVSYGKERPAVAGSDDSSWSQNRRGVTVVQ